MKIRQQRVNTQKSISRFDEDVGSLTERGPSVGKEALDSSNRGGADGDEPSRFLSCPSNFTRRLSPDFDPLGVECGPREGFLRKGLKGAQADVQSDRSRSCARAMDLIENGVREVEASRRGGNGPGMTRINGLITLPIRRVFGYSADVRRERCLTDALTERMHVERREHLSPLTKHNDHFFTFAAERFDVDRGPLVGGLEYDTRAWPHGARRPGERQPLRILGSRLQEEKLYLSPRFTASAKSGPKHPSVIQEEKIPLTDTSGDFSKLPMLPGATLAIQYEEAGVTAARRRLLGDQPWRKIEVVGV